MKLFIVNLFFFFSLMPFISPYPLATDVQPVSVLLGSLLIVWRFFERRVFLDYFSICFIIISLFPYFIMELILIIVSNPDIGLA